jgi:hypothetical protein
MGWLAPTIIVIVVLGVVGFVLWKKGYLPKKVHDEVEEFIDKVEEEVDEFKDAVKDKVDDVKDKLDKDKE